MYSIGEVEKITGIKSHILRYWEENIIQLKPKKDTGGRRVYSQNDVNLIFRLRYLINEKGFTVEGAKKQIMSETQNASEKQMNAVLQLRQLRSDLLELLKEGGEKDG